VLLEAQPTKEFVTPSRWRRSDVSLLETTPPRSPAPTLDRRRLDRGVGLTNVMGSEIMKFCMWRLTPQPSPALREWERGEG